MTDFYRDHPPQYAHLSSKVIFLSESPQFASLVSDEAINEVVKKKKEYISHKCSESGNGCKEPGDYLLKSAMTLSHASSVAIVTWSRKVSHRQLAAVAGIAKVLVAQEKEVTVLTTESNTAEWEKLLAKCEAEQIILKSIPVISVTIMPTHWSRDVQLALCEVFSNLGPSFHSTSLNSVVLVNDQGESLDRLKSLVTIFFMSVIIMCLGFAYSCEQDQSFRILIATNFHPYPLHAVFKVFLSSIFSVREEFEL